MRDLKKRIGDYVTKKTGVESYKAYVPKKLPPNPALDMEKIYGKLERATALLSEFSNLTRMIPNTSLFIYMYVRKEALLSSQIEGTQSSFTDLMLFEHNTKPLVSKDDVEEVSNYVKAIKHGLKRMREGVPLSLRLLKEVHAILLSGVRGG